MSERGKSKGKCCNILEVGTTKWIKTLFRSDKPNFVPSKCTNLKIIFSRYIRTSSNMLLLFSFSLSMSLCAMVFASVSGSSTSVKSIELYFGCSVLTYCNLSSCKLKKRRDLDMLHCLCLLGYLHFWSNNKFSC